MENKKILIICESIHHGNTRKLAEVMAAVLGAEIKKASEVKEGEINNYDLVGFGSGIYDDKLHVQILRLVDRLPQQNNKKAFIFSTSGVPVKILGQKFFNNYTKKCHNNFAEKITAKGFSVVGDFSRPGFNTNAFLKYFGGLNKNRPDQKDFEDAKAFAIKLK